MKSALVIESSLPHNYTATQNACKLCTPLGAALAFQGIEGCVPLLHGSQGCSTYMRRYLISHFKEPVDIASSNFTEETAIFGGGANLKLAIENITRQYSPAMIGIATTCLSETIGDDVPMLIDSIKNVESLPELVHVSTASYTGTHIDGFHQAVKAVVDKFNPESVMSVEQKRCEDSSYVLEASDGEQIIFGEQTTLNCFPGMLSNEDIRHLKEIFLAMSINAVILPDYCERLDGEPWFEYQIIQKGGTKVSAIRTMHKSVGSIELGRILAAKQNSKQSGSKENLKESCSKVKSKIGNSSFVKKGDFVKNGDKQSAGQLLSDRFGVPCMGVGFPIGVKETDLFFDALEKLTGKAVPDTFISERGRLIDSYIDCNKYLSGKRAVVYGEEDLVVGVASFLSEIGVVPVLCASGGKSGSLKSVIEKIMPSALFKQIRVRDGVDFMEIEHEARECCPDFLIGSSKGYATSRRLKIPLVRVGFPVHDRVGGSRILHIGYSGAQRLLDQIVNTLLERRQERSDIGYSYM
ncbi:MAG: nitrogenase [Desulfamplus sp.]|nr:nitrogenase [Desulfamplus sp.]